MLPVPRRPGHRRLARVYDEAYTGTPPNWDIGRPQRAFVYLAESGLVRDQVLDVGCGTGELSMFLARRGHDVLGIDISSVAIDRAREKARWRRIAVRFAVWDALELGRLAALGLSFQTVVDCAMLHVLRSDQRERFVRELEQVVPSGGLYCVLGDAREAPGDGYGITPEEIRSRFEALGGWQVAFAYRTVFERRGATNPAYFLGVRRH